MVKVELSGKLFTSSLDVISGLVTEATFKVTPKGVQMISMDPANVAMVIFNMDKSEFVRYEVEAETAVAVNVGNLKQFLKRGKEDDRITIELKDSKLEIVIQGATKRKFDLPTLEIEQAKKIPALEFKTTIKMKSAELKSAVEDVGIVSETCQFELGDVFKMGGHGDLMQAEIACVYDVSKSEKQKALYSIEYLNKIVAASKISEDVEVSWNDNYPASFKFGKTMEVILAPRVEG